VKRKRAKKATPYTPPPGAPPVREVVAQLSAKRQFDFKVGDRVVRNKAVGAEVASRGDVVGTILKVTRVPHGSGGTRARIRVRWDNGFVGSVEDRQIVLASSEES
jgi:hypothetical protein